MDLRKLQKIRPIKALLSTIADSFLERGKEPTLPISSLPGFNRKIWGLKEKELVILGARPSQGKSSLAMQLAFDIAEKNFPVLFLSLEMDAESIIERLFCNVMEVNNEHLLMGGYKDSLILQNKWITFIKIVEKLPLMITCGIGKTFDEINEIIEMMSITPKVVIIDYIQGIKTKAKQTLDDMNEYIRKFRELSITKEFCGILCSQINRQATLSKNNEPNMGQLKSTGVLEEHSDKVILLHWDRHYDEEADPNKFKLILSKNRNGRTGNYYVKFEPEYYRFRENMWSDNAKGE